MESGATYEVSEPLSVNGARIFVCEDALIHMTKTVNEHNINNPLKSTVHPNDIPAQLEIREEFRKQLYTDMREMYKILQSLYVHSLQYKGIVNLDLVKTRMETAIQGLPIYDRQQFGLNIDDMAICSFWSRSYVGIWANNGTASNWRNLEKAHIAYLQDCFKDSITNDKLFRFVYDNFLSLYPIDAGSMYIEYHREVFLTAAIQGFWANVSDESAVQRRIAKAHANGRTDVNDRYRRNNDLSYNGPKTYAEFIAPYLPVQSRADDTAQSRSRSALTVFKNPLNVAFELDVFKSLTKPSSMWYKELVDGIIGGTLLDDEHVPDMEIRRSISFDIKLLQPLFRKMFKFIVLSIASQVDPSMRLEIIGVEIEIRNILTSWDYIINLDFGPLSIHRSLFVCELCRQEMISIALYLPMFQNFFKDMQDERKKETTAYPLADHDVRLELIDRIQIPEDIGIRANDSKYIYNDFVWILNRFNPFEGNIMNRTTAAIFNYVSEYWKTIKQPEYFNTHYEFHANAYAYMKSIGESIASIQLFRFKSDLSQPWFHYELYKVPYDEIPDLTIVEKVTAEMANKFLMLLHLVRNQLYGDIHLHIKGNPNFREIAFMFSPNVTWNKPGITALDLSWHIFRKFHSVA